MTKMSKKLCVNMTRGCPQDIHKSPQIRKPPDTRYDMLDSPRGPKGYGAKRNHIRVHGQ
jgi:hypothetical protein